MDCGSSVQGVASLRDALKAFYSVVKTLEPKQRFTFLTGVSKFSKVSIFSDQLLVSDCDAADSRVAYDTRSASCRVAYGWCMGSGWKSYGTVGEALAFDSCQRWGGSRGIGAELNPFG